LTDIAIRSIGEYFGSIMQWSAAVSIAAYKTKLLGRSEGIVKWEHWSKVRSGEVILDLTAFTTGLTARGANAADITRFNQEAIRVHHELGQITDERVVRRVMHGHVGWEMLWSGVGWAIGDAGATASVRELVATGHRDTKMRYAAEKLAIATVRGHGETPSALARWLVSNT
jgi:hypothetical protein